MPDPRLVDRLLSSHPLISDQVDKTELRVILVQLMHQLERYSGSAILEMGCYVGTTSLFIRRLMDACDVTATFHVYDSFEGLPDKSGKDRSPVGEQFRRGELSVSRKTFSQQFKKAGLREPIVHRGWFSELTPEAIPDSVSFAYLDGDYYHSILDSLKLVWPKLLPGAIVVVDDYANEALPGTAIAVNEWLARHPARLNVEASLAVLSVVNTS